MGLQPAHFVFKHFGFFQSGNMPSSHSLCFPQRDAWLNGLNAGPTVFDLLFQIISGYTSSAEKMYM